MTHIRHDFDDTKRLISEPGPCGKESNEASVRVEISALKEPTMIKSLFVSFGRRAQVALIATVAAAGALMLGSGYVDASPLGWLHDDEAEIAKLTVCYALATDTIGAG